MEVVVDLEKTEKINTVICGFLESHRSWIFLPKGVKISFSSDGETFINAREILLNDGENYGASNRKEVFFRDLNQSARYVLIKKQLIERYVRIGMQVPVEKPGCFRMK